MLFLHVTSHVPGRAGDDLLRTLGRSGFPTIVAMDAAGRVQAVPEERSIDGFTKAMARAAAAVAAAATLADRPAKERLAAEFVRRLEVGELTDPARDRDAYLACRDALTAEQRAAAEQRLVLAELGKAQADGMAAEYGTKEHTEAMLAMLACKAKLGGRWPQTTGSNRVLITLMTWAERRRDPQLFAALFEDFVQVRRAAFAWQKKEANEAFIAQWKDRLQRLWKGEAPQRGPRERQTPPRRRR